MLGTTKAPLEKEAIMRLIFIFISFVLLPFACSTSGPIHPPKKHEQKIYLLTEWVQIKTQFLYEIKKEYSVSERASDMLWLETAIDNGYKKGYITTTEEANWLRKFYVHNLLNNITIKTYKEIEHQIREYANNNPPPLRRKITVDAVANASSDTQNGWKNGVEVELSKGIWQIKPIGGGWSCWRSNSIKPPSVKGAYTWNVFIKRPFIDSSFFYGPNDWWQFNTPREALNYAQKNFEPYTFSLSSPGSVYFWIYDTEPISDNRGYVTLEISRSD